MQTQLHHTLIYVNPAQGCQNGYKIGWWWVGLTQKDKIGVVKSLEAQRNDCYRTWYQLLLVNVVGASEQQLDKLAGGIFKLRRED